MKLKAVACVGALAITLTACTNQEIGTGAGALIGGTVGGLVTQRLGVGGQIAGTVGGALIGGLIGGQIGAYLDEQERQQLAAMTITTASTGSTRTYVSPKTKTRIVTRRVGPPIQRASSQQQAQAPSCTAVERTIKLADGTEKSETINTCRDGSGWRTG